MMMKRWIAFLLCLALALPALACADGVFRPLPIDLSGGAPYDAKYGTDVTVYEDPTIRVERTRVEDHQVWRCTYYTAHITIKDPSQLRTASAENFRTKMKVPATTIARRVNAVLAINGDYTMPFDGSRTNGYILRQGVVYRETAEKNLDILLIDEDGDFHVLTPDMDLENIDKTTINGKKVINAFQFGPALVIDGKKQPNLTDKSRSPLWAEPDERGQRMCIAQIGPLEYLCVCCARYGLDLDQLADLTLSLADVKVAYTLDGGNSTQMVFLGKKVNNVQSNSDNVRKITDIVYFCSAWFEE